MLVEEMLGPLAGYCVKNVVIDIKCYHDLIYHFPKTCNKLKVPLTVWLDRSKGLT